MTLDLSNLEENFVGYRTKSEVEAEKDENGYWTVTYNLIQEMSLDGEEWNTREASSSATAKDLQKAIGDATITMIYYLDSVDGDLFNEVVEEEEKELLQ